MFGRQSDALQPDTSACFPGLAIIVLFNVFSCIAAPWRLASAWQCMALFQYNPPMNNCSEHALTSSKTLHQVPRSGWTPPDYPQRGGV